MIVETAHAAQYSLSSLLRWRVPMPRGDTRVAVAVGAGASHVPLSTCLLVGLAWTLDPSFYGLTNSVRCPPAGIIVL